MLKYLRTNNSIVPMLISGYISCQDPAFTVWYEELMIGQKRLLTFHEEQGKPAFASHVQGNSYVRYDSDGDGTLDAVGNIGENPVGLSPCDLYKNLKEKQKPKT